MIKQSSLILDKQREICLFKLDEHDCYQLQIRNSNPMATNPIEIEKFKDSVASIKKGVCSTVLNFHPDTMDAIVMAYFQLDCPKGYVLTEVQITSVPNEDGKLSYEVEKTYKPEKDLTPFYHVSKKEL